MKIISLTLCIVMILSLFTGCVIKPGGAMVSGESSSEATYEITNETIVTIEDFSNKEETDTTKETIKQPEEKQEPQPVIENTSEAVINEIVEKQGVKGLTKRQYVQYFINNMETMRYAPWYVIAYYNGNMTEFIEKYIKEGSIITGICKTETKDKYYVFYRRGKMKTIVQALNMLVEDDKIRFVQPHFSDFAINDVPTIEIELNIDDYKAVTDEISDAAIEKVLKSEGLLELTKRQYIRYFSKYYKNSSFEESEILMEYTGNMVDFAKKYITDDSFICGFEDNVVYLNRRSPELVLKTMMMLAEDDKVVHVQPNFRYTFD